LDIDPGFDAKHEFWMVWRHFIAIAPSPSYERTEESLADFLNFAGYDVLLPVARSHHPWINLVRLMSSADQQTLTLLLHDSLRELSARFALICPTQGKERLTITELGNVKNPSNPVSTTHSISTPVVNPGGHIRMLMRA
jgi:hypothetical protein